MNTMRCSVCVDDFASTATWLPDNVELFEPTPPVRRSIGVLRDDEGRPVDLEACEHDKEPTRHPEDMRSRAEFSGNLEINASHVVSQLSKMVKIVTILSFILSMIALIVLGVVLVSRPDVALALTYGGVVVIFGVVGLVGAYVRKTIARKWKQRLRLAH